MASILDRILIWFATLVMAAIAVSLVIEYVPGARDRVASALARYAPAGNAGSGGSAASQGPVDAGEQALDQGDRTGALRLAAAAVSAHQDDADVDNRAGNVAQRAGDAAAAERYYQMGETADGRDPWNFVALGEMYAEQGKYMPADAQLRAALTIVPKAPFLHYDLGVVELHEHLNEAALADFETELKANPSYAPARHGRAQALAALGQPARLLAEAELKQRNGARSPVVRKPAPKPSSLPIATVAIPSPSPTAAPTAEATATSQPTATPEPTPAATPAALLLAERQARAARLAERKRLRQPKLAAAAASAEKPAPVPTAQSLTDLAADARSYLLGVASDIGFTGGLPSGDPSLSTAVLQAQIDRSKSTPTSDISALLQAGSAALRSGRISIAYSAFTAATAKAPSDWHGPYYAGLTAQAAGNYGSARDFFREAIGRGAGSQAFVSLAVSEVAQGDDGDALAQAQHAADTDPTYGPGRFAAGMIALLEANAPVADRNLAAAMELGGAPERTEYFLTALRKREGLQ